MGPNGSGKSTLSYVVAGHPHYEVTQGDILLDGESILDMEADERARTGIFLAFQYPVSIPGVSVRELPAHRRIQRSGLHQQRGRKQCQRSHRSNLMPMRKFRRELNTKMKEFNVDSSLLDAI